MPRKPTNPSGKLPVIQCCDPLQKIWDLNLICLYINDVDDKLVIRYTDSIGNVHTSTKCIFCNKPLITRAGCNYE